MLGGRGSGTAAVLFTDLVDSTGLLSGLGEAAFDELRRAHFAALRDAIRSHGGEEVKTLGDGVLAVFGSAADAVASAVAIQQAVARQRRAGSAPVAIRVGLAVGDVSFEEGDVFGTPVIEAARLVAAARGNQILTTGLVRDVAGDRAPAGFTDAGALELKGLPRPVVTCEVAWEALRPPAPPVPPLLKRAGRVFVERQRELELLERWWKGALTGERRAVFLAGEPGVGKTRLSAELASVVQADGAIVLAGRCDEDLGVPYQPVVEALTYFVGFTAGAELPDRLGRHSGELIRLVPELARRLPGVEPLRADPETERYRLFDAVAAWLARASQETPVLLVVDDVHWAAKPTLLLLRHVLRSAEPARLLVVATYRDTELHRGHPLRELLADLRRDGTIERITLSGLDPSGVVAFMEQAAGHRLDDDGLALAAAIHEETQGNPFFVAELLRHLAETGAIAQHAGRWAPQHLIEELGIPEGVRDVIGQRLTRLSESANEVLRLAAVVGEEFEPAVVQAASGGDEDTVLTALEEACAARVVVPGTAGRFRFVHALIRGTLYEEISLPRRAVFHRRVAEALETLHSGRLDEYLPALSHHFSRAAAPTAAVGKAVAYTARAGDRALELLAHDEAAEYYRHALDLLDASETPLDDQRLELLISLGEAQRRAGDPGHRETLLEAGRLAEQRGDAAALSRAALANMRGLLFSSVGEVDAARLAALEAALRAVGPADSPTRAQLLAQISQELVFAGDYDHCQRLSDEALAIARRLGEDRTLADVLVARYHAIAVPDTLSERVANSAELLAVADRLGDPMVTSQALWLAYRAALESGDVAEATRRHQRSEQLSAELGQPSARWFDAWNADGLALLAGRIAEAERMVEEASALADEIGQPDRELFATVQRYQVRFEQGRLAEMEEPLARLVERNPGFPLPRALQAVLASELERREEAGSRFEGLAGDDFADIPRNVYWLRTMTDAAAVCAYLSDERRAGVLYDRLAPYADQLVVAIRLVTGSVDYYLGLLAATLGRFDDAGRHLAAAAARHERIGAPPWLARTQLAQARLLLRAAGDGADGESARQLAGEALATARRLGLGTVERRAAAVLDGLA
jgi:class 3 adenylate cyclase